MADLSSFSAAMKTKFIGPIRDNLNSNKILLHGQRTRQGQGGDTPDPQGGREFRGIEALAEGIDFVGNEFRIPIRTGRNASPGSRAENAALPAAGNEGFNYLSEPLRYSYASFSITGPLLKASESNEGAFKRALTTEMEGTIDALKRKMNIDAYGDGSGDLGTCRTAVGPTTTLTVDSTIYFEAGDIVDVYDITGAVYLAAAREVTSVNRTNRTITISGANISVDVGDRIIRASSDSLTGTPNNDKDVCINGLEKIVNSTGQLHTLDPASLDLWKSTKIDANSALVGETYLRDLVDGVGFESGSDEEIVFITTRGVRKRYANTLMAMKRFNDAQSVKLQGGFKALLFDDMPMVVDDHCTIGRVYALNTKALFWSQNSDWEWMEEDGAVLNRVPGYDRYTAVLFKYCNLGTFARNRHGVIVNAQDDTK